LQAGQRRTIMSAILDRFSTIECLMSCMY